MHRLMAAMFLGLLITSPAFSGSQVTIYARGLEIPWAIAFSPDGRLIRDRIILDDIPGAFVHDGGRIAFGPDGMLYIGTGDAQKMDLAQNPQSLAGKILRVTPDGGIPRDNPMAGSPVYSLGHRNVQGLAWHPETKRLYATEHGPSGERGCCQDEVNVIRPAGNYGWPDVTGEGLPIHRPAHAQRSGDLGAIGGRLYLRRAMDGKIPLRCPPREPASDAHPQREGGGGRPAGAAHRGFRPVAGCRGGS